MNTFETLFYDAPIPYHEIDAQGVIQRVNRAECEMLGYTEDQLLNTPVWRLVCGEETEASRTAIREKLEGLRPLIPFRRTYLSRDHRQVVVEIHERLLRDASGKAVSIRSALLDITERARAEEALDEYKRWLEAIMRSIGEAIVAVDAFGWIVHMNAAAETLTGFTIQQARGMAFEQCLVLSEIRRTGHPDEPAEMLFRQCLFEEWRGSALLTEKSGSTKRVQIHSAPLLHDSSSIAGFVLVVDDRPAEGS